MRANIDHASCCLDQATLTIAALLEGTDGCRTASSLPSIPVLLRQSPVNGAENPLAATPYDQ